MPCRVSILRRFITYLLFWVIPFFLTSNVHAQEPNRWRTYARADGLLMSSNISGLVQDGQGFLWTIYDLQRFDGNTFKTYKEDYEDSLGFRIPILGGNIGMHVDDTGVIWFDGEASLSRFDSEKDGFVTYHPWIGLDYITKQVTIVRSLAGSKTDLWVGTRGHGIFHLNLETGKRERYFNMGSDSLASVSRNFVFKILDKGKYLLCKTGQGLWKFDKSNKRFTRLLFSGNDSTLFSGDLVHVVEIFPHGDHYWFMIHFNHTDPKELPEWHYALVKTDSVFSIMQKLKVSYDLNQNSGIVQDSQGVFWMATNGKGVLRADPATGQSTLYGNEPDNPFSLPSNDIRKLIVDRNENVWVMTDEGLSRLIRGRVDFYNYKIGAGMAAGIEFFNDKNNGYLVTATQTSGIWTTDFHRNGLGSLHFQHLAIKNKSEKLEYIEATTKSWDGLWVLSQEVESILKLPVNPVTGKIEGRVVQDIHNDHNSLNYNIGVGLIIPGIPEDDKKNLWVVRYAGADASSLNKVVFTQKGSVDTVLHFIHDPGNPNSVSRGQIGFIYPDANDSVWVPTTYGLDLFHDGRFQHIFNHESTWVGKARDGTLLVGTATEGLFEGTIEGGHYRFTNVAPLGVQEIYAIEEDRLGRLWVSKGANGLFCYNRKDQTVQHFQKEDGYEGALYIGWATEQTPDGIMAFPTKDGLVLFDPLTFRISETKPRPLITQLEVNNKPVVVDGHPSNENDFVITQSIGSLTELALDYTHNFFTVEFAAMELTNPERNLYRYKLEGLSDDWIQTDWRHRKATYMNLEPGKYTFKVKATNYDGIWNDNEVTTLAITVFPPPWKTWWAYTLYFFTITGSTWYYIKSRERLLKERQVELEQTVTERTADVVAEKKEVEKQRNRSDELLLNILPSEVAEELKQSGSAAAKQFDNVTVMFTDFKNFTQISEKLTPAELVAEIHSCFKAFDNIITKYNIEKIKTIGDSYMCVGGLPVPNETNATDVVNAALEIQQFIIQNADQRRREGKEPFEIRIGVNTGPVVAGIVGIKKFAYDIWGDTVNIASRMESSGEAGRVNISQSTYERVKDSPELRFEPRGKIEAKHKGVIEMYFVERA